MIKFMRPPLAPEHLLERKNLWAFVFAEGKIKSVYFNFCRNLLNICIIRDDISNLTGH